MRIALNIGPEAVKLLEKIKLNPDFMLSSLSLVDLLHVAATIGLRAMAKEADVKTNLTSIRD